MTDKPEAYRQTIASIAKDGSKMGRDHWKKRSTINLATRSKFQTWDEEEGRNQRSTIECGKDQRSEVEEIKD